jgi:hypothetical protein
VQGGRKAAGEVCGFSPASATGAASVCIEASVRHSSLNGATIMRKFNLFGMAFAVAAAAFVLAMLHDPPKSVASDPVKGITVSDVKIPAGLTSGTYEAY